MRCRWRAPEPLRHDIGVQRLAGQTERNRNRVHETTSLANDLAFLNLRDIHLHLPSLESRSLTVSTRERVARRRPPSTRRTGQRKDDIVASRTRLVMKGTAR